jgi:hypothetical protein
MSDIIMVIPSECIVYNSDKTISIPGKIPKDWTYGINETKLQDFLNDKVVGYCREPPAFKVITKINIKLELEGKEQ